MRTNPMILGLLLVVATLAVSCNGNGDTIINQTIDCGLVRSELLGTWTVDLATGAPTLQSCTGSDLSRNNTSSVTTDFPAQYAPVDVFGSDGSTSFKLVSDRFDSHNDPSVAAEMTGSVQADSCVGILRVWDRTDTLFYQCIGTFVRSNGTMSGACDSAEIDSDSDGQLDTSCSLSQDVNFNAAVQ